MYNKYIHLKERNYPPSFLLFLSLSMRARNTTPENAALTRARQRDSRLKPKISASFTSARKKRGHSKKTTESRQGGRVGIPRCLVAASWQALSAQRFETHIRGSVSRFRKAYSAFRKAFEKPICGRTTYTSRWEVALNGHPGVDTGGTKTPKPEAR